MNLKVVVTSGETDQEKLQKLGNSVLGVGFDATTDTLSVNLKPISKQPTKITKRSSVKPVHPIDTVTPPSFTLRTCLSTVNRIYDPLGHATPVSSRFKISFRDLFRTGLDLHWDDS